MTGTNCVSFGNSEKMDTIYSYFKINVHLHEFPHKYSPYVGKKNREKIEELFFSPNINGK